MTVHALSMSIIPQGGGAIDVLPARPTAFSSPVKLYLNFVGKTSVIVPYASVRDLRRTNIQQPQTVNVEEEKGGEDKADDVVGKNQGGVRQRTQNQITDFAPDDEATKGPEY